MPPLRHSLLAASLAVLPLSCGPGLEPRPANAAPSDVARSTTAVASASTPAKLESVPSGPPLLPEFELRPGDEVDPHQPIEDPSNEALDYFNRALTRLDASEPGADKVRVLHLGDSTLGLDGITHSIRKRMQGRFGDGGPGLLLLKRYSLSYKPAVVQMRGGDDWTHCYIAYLCRNDGRYGLGGLIVSASAGASTIFASHRDAPIGTHFSTAELWYAASEVGGAIEIEVDGEHVRTIDSKAPGIEGLEDRWETITLEPGPHSLEVRAAGGGKSRIYGMVLESERPGVVWDGTSMIGAFTKRLLAWDPDHIAAQVRHRDPALIVFTYGGNDLRRIVAGSLDEDGYVAEAGAVIDLVRSGKPEASCLITSVIDHGRSGTYTVEPEHVAIMVAAQRRLAFEKGCAFFDSWTAMGGPNSIRAWLNQKPRLAEPDLKHLNHRGRDLMGQWIHEALLASYVAYRRAGIDE